jgi:hypothetical protein
MLVGVTDELHRIADAVRNEAGLVELLMALEADRRVARAAELAEAPTAAWDTRGAWENGTIEDYLEAASAWLKDTSGRDDARFGSDNPWRRVAIALVAAAMYE